MQDWEFSKKKKDARLGGHPRGQGDYDLYHTTQVLGWPAFPMLLICLVTSHKIAIADMFLGKAPVPDGLTILLVMTGYYKWWLSQSINDFYELSLIKFHVFNMKNIVHLPNKDGADSISDLQLTVWFPWSPRLSPWQWPTTLSSKMIAIISRSQSTHQL